MQVESSQVDDGCEDDASAHLAESPQLEEVAGVECAEAAQGGLRHHGVERRAVRVVPVGRVYLRRREQQPAVRRRPETRRHRDEDKGGTKPGWGHKFFTNPEFD